MNEEAEAPAAGRTITLRFLSILGGVVVAFLVARLLSLGLVATGLNERIFVLPIAQFIALLSGGYAAGRWARVSGFMNGVAVAVVYIAVWAVLNSVYEARLVQEAGPMALPRMNMGGIILGDLLNLSAAAFGGWLSERKGS